jgi:hypothetical protein
MGLPGRPSSSHVSKMRFASTQVAKAVCMALTPTIPTIERIVIRPRDGCISRISTQPFEQILPGTLFLTRSTNSSKYFTKQPFLLDIEMFSRLLIPFYAARAFEEVRYGPGGVSLSTFNELNIGAGVAHSIITQYRQQLYESRSIELDTTIGIESLVSNLIEVAYLEAKRLVIQRTYAIEKVARMLLSAPSEMLSGDLLIESILEEPISDVDSQLETNLSYVKHLITKKLTTNILNDSTSIVQNENEMIKSTFRLLSGNILPYLHTCESDINWTSRDLKMMHDCGLTEYPDRFQAVHTLFNKYVGDKGIIPFSQPLLAYNGSTLEEWLKDVKSKEFKTAKKSVPFKRVVNETRLVKKIK